MISSYQLACSFMIQQPPPGSGKRLCNKLFTILTGCMEPVGLQRSSRESPWCTASMIIACKMYAIYKASLLFGSLVSLPRAHRIELIGHAYVAYCCVWS